MTIPPLADFLESKPLFYTKFDPNRIKEAFKLVKNHIKNPTRVQIIGTNGKGSTGRALAYLACKSGLSVGHFTSPHIFDFKERFWIDNSFASSNSLEKAHKRLYETLGKEMANSLSYFEYQALLCGFLFEDCDLQLIEAGLGGEFDATSVYSYDLNIFTPISFDHSDFLGENIDDIAKTKLKAMQKKALLAKQEFSEVVDIAKKLAKEKNVDLKIFDENRFKKLKNIIKKPYPNYLIENFTLSTQGLDELDIKYKKDDLNNLEIFGRFYKIKPNITIDVGHNPLAAKVIAKVLDKKVVLIFNILSDKDAKSVLEILKPKIKRVELIKLNNQRASDIDKLKDILRDLNIYFSNFEGYINKNEEYLVFGSFYVVEKFLKEIGVNEIE